MKREMKRIYSEVLEGEVISRLRRRIFGLGVL